MSKKNSSSKVFEPLDYLLIDSHCHVVPRTYKEETNNVITRVFNSNMYCAINIGAGYGMEGNYEVLDIYKLENRLHPTIGIHPHDASLFAEDNDLAEILYNLARKDEVVGYGEIGLDYYYNNSPKEVQLKAFQIQLDIAKELKKPVIIHDRDAHDDIVSNLMHANIWDQGVIIHCFSGNWDLAEIFLNKGAYISIPGVITFKNATEIQDVAKRIPLDNLLIETDSPFLAPVPYRGKQNEPHYVHLVAKAISEIRKEDVLFIAEKSVANTKKVFNLNTLANT